MRQFVWCLPVVPDKRDETPVDAHALASRIAPLARGVVPEDVTHLTAAVDIGTSRSFSLRRQTRAAVNSASNSPFAPAAATNEH